MKKIILIIVLSVLIIYAGLRIWAHYYLEKHRSLTYEEAGTDFSKVFNNERKKVGLPIKIKRTGITIDTSGLLLIQLIFFNLLVLNKWI